MEWELVVSAFSLAVSGFALFQSQKAMNAARAQTEIAINERITDTQEKVSDHTLLITPLAVKQSRTLEEDATLEVYKKIFNAAVERNLNAYETACSLYRDKKVDRARFKKAYDVSIRQLVEDTENRDVYFNATTTRYKATYAVYQEWNNHENKKWWRLR